MNALLDAKAQSVTEEPRTLIDELIAEQQTLTAVERFSRLHQDHAAPAQERFYRDLIPLAKPRPGEQYAFVVDLDKCSGCKACVTACHSLNGLDEDETWRKVGLLVNTGGRARLGDCQGAGRSVHAQTSRAAPPALTPPIAAFQQHVTTACHHCVDPACLNGCPVLAYDKDPLTGIVRHLDDQCIGCSYCVMKCPYEVPKYSAQRGIVRKCDMCANRLAVNEAPACVQACPSEAIRIEIVEQVSVRTKFRAPSDQNHEGAIGERRRPVAAEVTRRILGPPLQENPPPNLGGCERPMEKGDAAASNSFLPDSPDPRITLPTTRYLSRRPFAPGTLAADHLALRLEPSHWPLAAMLLLTQAAAGVFLACIALPLIGQLGSLLPLKAMGLLVLLAGLAVSIFHLGQPRKAWRAFLGWRRSWLSREIIALSVFAAFAAFAVAAELGDPGPTVHLLGSVALSRLGSHAVTARFAALAGLLAVFASAMVYIDTRRPFWAARLVFREFFGTTLLLGAVFTSMMLAWRGQLTLNVQLTVLAALGGRGALLLWQRWELRRAARDSRSQIHCNALVVRELLPETIRMQSWLFAASLVFGLLTLGRSLDFAAGWATLAASAALGAEILGRFVFFAASASKRMPGGVAA